MASWRFFSAPAVGDGAKPLINVATLAEVASRIPKGVVCLLSALRFHGLSDEFMLEEALGQAKIDIVKHLESAAQSGLCIHYLK